ncbi:phosphotransferase family protein [Nocardioides sp.]|uniref:phosphotransferase family protein n=1 Tax=Nocardioides sp. TaxID=35761 RepID=UPI003D0EA4FC
MSDPRGLDLAAFTRWYDGQRPGEIVGPLSAELIAGGKSNLTYQVTDGASWWIVRRPPLGHVQATAHDMGREYTAMTALADTPVPVPRTYAHCPDPEVLGAPFYVMERVLGTPYRTAAQLIEIGPERTANLLGGIVDVLADLHAVDPAEVGLAGFGRPEGFLARQVRRWGQQLDGSRHRELPEADELRRLLTEHVPETGHSGIVHGDYRLDNLLVADDEIRAVVDWEMATLGDPLTDIALMLVYDRLSGIAGGASVADASLAPGYPDNEAQLARYAAVSGRDLSELDFHIALACFKLAVILEGIDYRHLQGQTVGAGFDTVGQAVHPLLEAGLEAIRTHTN